MAPNPQREFLIFPLEHIFKEPVLKLDTVAILCDELPECLITLGHETTTNGSVSKIECSVPSFLAVFRFSLVLSH